MKFIVFLVFLVPIFARAKQEAPAKTFDSSKMSYSLGVTQGKMRFLDASNKADQSYTQAELTFNYSFTELYSLRAAFLSRFTTGKEYWGLQLSAPFKAQLFKKQSYSVIGYMSPGYRFIHRYHAPFVASGVQLNLGSISLGVSYRLIFNELFSDELKDEGQVVFHFNLNLP